MKHSFRLSLVFVSLFSGLVAMNNSAQTVFGKRVDESPASVVNRVSPGEFGSSSPVTVRRSPVDVALDTSQGRALLKCTASGYCSEIIKPLFDHVTKDCSPVITAAIRSRVEAVHQEQSPTILALKAKINCGATPSKEREVLENQLKKFQSQKVISRYQNFGR